ncbi:hypothetical protein L3i22_096340 [Actinoplanes sp. L3-i22]|nr:hypothetical protein L3i22_096340 [Actinoplanes sp. L3-i22]
MKPQPPADAALEGLAFWAPRALRDPEGSPRERRSVIGRSRGNEEFDLDLERLPGWRPEGMGTDFRFGVRRPEGMISPGTGFDPGWARVRREQRGLSGKFGQSWATN